MISMLVVGMLIFLLPHLLPMFPAQRLALVERFGEKGYKGLFALVSLVGFILIIMGMRGVPYEHVYAPPAWGRHLTMLLVLTALFFLLARRLPSNLPRFTAHPMNWGVAAWATGHLLSNGDLASVILFGGFGVYALVDIVSANRRGAKPQGAAVPWFKDAIVLGVALVAYVGLVAAHGWIAGVPLIA